MPDPTRFARYTAWLRTTASSRTFTRRAHRRTPPDTWAPARAIATSESDSSRHPDAADQIGRHIHRVYLGQVALNLAHRHAPGLHCNDLVIETGEMAFMLADQLGIEGSLAVARGLNAQRAIANITAPHQKLEDGAGQAAGVGAFAKNRQS